jgi:polyhydroxybutyrate depolymerase
MLKPWFVAAGLLIAALAAGCDSSETPSADSAAQENDGPQIGDSELGVTDALAVPVGVSSFTITMEWDQRKRTILYLRPASATKAPALVLLHYRGGDPSHMANYTDATQFVQKYGAWVILPQGIDGDWSDDPKRDANRTDDSGFLAALIAQSVADYPLDRQRIYMAGFSKGGFMAERYACDHADTIAAAAWVGATLLNTLRDACTPSRKLPVLGINGTADRKVPYDGETGVASAPETMEFFAGLNACTASATRALTPTVQDGTSIELETFSHCPTGAQVYFYTVVGGGHTWPDSPYPRPMELGPTTQNLDADSAIWSFFKGFTLP